MYRAEILLRLAYAPLWASVEYQTASMERYSARVQWSYVAAKAVVGTSRTVLRGGGYWMDANRPRSSKNPRDAPRIKGERGDAPEMRTRARAATRLPSKVRDHG